MGRKPNPVIATHFIRGEKHGQTTNRYAQTCSHCNLHFPTGRPETLFAHLASCPGLSHAERADVLQQMYSTSTSNAGISTTTGASNQTSIPISSHDDDFDITGLNVLAGAAENAEDLAIDPRISGHGSVGQLTATTSQPLPFYDNHFGHSFPHQSSHNAWSFHLPHPHGSSPPYHDTHDVTSADSPFTTIASPDLPQWSFAPVLTTPSTYVTHPNHLAPVTFADGSENVISQTEGNMDLNLLIHDGKPRTRKARESYTEPKRARVAEMRQIGVCIRCSRLRKTCEPTRPCKACSQTASKTWLGACTTLNKGQEFNFWYDRNLSGIAERRLAEADIENLSNDSKYRMDLCFFGMDGPKIQFEIVKIGRSDHDAMSDHSNDETDTNDFFIHKDEDIASKILEYALKNEELIIEAIDIPALYTTVRTAQGLSESRDQTDNHLIWGSAKQNEARLARIYELWLSVALLSNDKSGYEMVITNTEDGSITEDFLGENYPLLVSQIDAALEIVAQNTKEELKRFDANILNQSYKYLFNLVIGIVLILDAIERYCCFIKYCSYLSGEEESRMFEQAKSLAYKYAYCVQNIQMLPEPGFDTQALAMVGKWSEGRIDHEMQRIWMADLCLSKDDLELHLDNDESEEWTVPKGKLWMRLFRRIR